MLPIKYKAPVGNPKPKKKSQKNIIIISIIHTINLNKTINLLNMKTTLIEVGKSASKTTSKIYASTTYEKAVNDSIHYY